MFKLKVKPAQLATWAQCSFVRVLVFLSLKTYLLLRIVKIFILISITEIYMNINQKYAFNVQT